MTIRDDFISKRYDELDVLRGLAIFAIVLFHYTTRYDRIYGHSEMTFAFPYGHLGVQLFYMLSGFLIYMSLENINNSRDFVTKRLTRLYPAYWFSIFLTYGLVSFLTLPGREASFIDVLANLTMLQAWLPGIKNVDGAYWTLSRFISFYFIMFLIHNLCLKSNIIPICYLWLLLIWITKLLEFVGFHIPGRIQLIFLLSDGSLFILGILFFLWKKSGLDLYKALAISLSLLTIYFINGKLIFISAIFFSTLFVLFIYNKLEFVTVKPLVWLGGISYPLYLVHQNIGYIIIRKLYQLDLNFYLIIALPILITLLMATGITYYIEKPSLQLIKQKIFSKD